MKDLVTYINEVSKETADNAFLKASSEVMRLTNEVTKDNFKNKELTMKLCKRIRQANLFKQYSDKLNELTASAVPESLAKCIKKWKEQGITVNGTKIVPMFILSGFDEKEFLCIHPNGFLSGTSTYDNYMVVPTDKRKKPYMCSREHLTELINSDHKVLPTQLLVIIPGTEDIDIDTKNADKRSKAYKIAKAFLDQLMEIKNDIHKELGIKPKYSWDAMYTLNKSKMSTPSDWSNLKWGMDGKDLEKVFKTNLLSELFPDKDGVVYMSIDIPKNIQSQFDMHGSILLTKDEVKSVELELNNDGSENETANARKFGKAYDGKDYSGSLRRGKIRADRYGKEL